MNRNNFPGMPKLDMSAPPPTKVPLLPLPDSQRYPAVEMNMCPDRNIQPEQDINIPPEHDRNMRPQQDRNMRPQKDRNMRPQQDRNTRLMTEHSQHDRNIPSLLERNMSPLPDRIMHTFQERNISPSSNINVLPPSDMNIHQQDSNRHIFPERNMHHHQQNMNMPHQQNMNMPPQHNMNMPPQHNMNMPPQHNMNMPPQHNMNMPPQPNMNIPPQHNMNMPPQQNMNMPPQHNMNMLQQNLNMPPQQNRNILPQQNMNMPPQQNMNMPPQQTMNMPPQQNMNMPPQQNIIMPPQRNMNIHPQQNINMPPQQNINMPPQQNMHLPLQQNMHLPLQQNMNMHLPFQQHINMPFQQNIKIPSQQNMSTPSQQNVNLIPQQNINIAAQKNINMPLHLDMNIPPNHTSLLDIKMPPHQDKKVPHLSDINKHSPQNSNVALSDVKIPPLPYINVPSLSDVKALPLQDTNNSPLLDVKSAVLDSKIPDMNITPSVLIPNVLGNETSNVLTTSISDEKNLNSSSTMPIEVHLDAESSPHIKSSPVKKVKLRTLGKEEAKKRLRAFTSANFKFKDQKLKMDEESALKRDEPLHKKKKSEKTSVIEQIKQEETRLKEVLVMHNCNSKYLGTGLASLTSLMDDPAAFKRFELKGRELRKKIDTNQLSTEIEETARETSSHSEKDMISEQRTIESSSHTDTIQVSQQKESAKETSSNRSIKPKSKQESVTERKKHNIVPKSWKQLKSLNISIKPSKLTDESDCSGSQRRESRHSTDNRKQLFPLDDKIWVGLSMQKTLIPLRVNRFLGHSKKEYCGSMVRTTVTKPHITFSKNSGKLTRHYMTRSEAKYRNKSSRNIWNYMKSLWEEKIPIKEPITTGITNWLMEDWISFDNKSSIKIDNLTTPGNSSVTKSSRKYKESEFQTNENVSSLSKISSDNLPIDDEESIKKSHASCEEIMDVSEDTVSDTLQTMEMADCEPSTKTGEDFIVESDNLKTIEKSLDCINVNTTDSKEVSPERKFEKNPNILTKVAHKMEQKNTNSSQNFDSVIQSEKEVVKINGKKISEMKLKTVKVLLNSGTISRKEKKLLKEAKKVLRKAKKEKKKLKKENKRKKKKDKKLSSQKEKPTSDDESDVEITNEEHVALDDTETNFSKNIHEDQGKSEVIYIPEEENDSESLNSQEGKNKSESIFIPDEPENVYIAVAENGSRSLNNLEEQNTSKGFNNNEKKNDSEVLYNPEEDTCAGSLYNPEEQTDLVNLNNSKNCPKGEYSSDNNKYSPSSSPFYFSNESDSSPEHTSNIAPSIQHHSLAIVSEDESLPQKVTSPQHSKNTTVIPMEIESIHAYNSIDLNSIPTPPSQSTANSGTKIGITTTIPVPVPPPNVCIPLPVPPVNLQYLQSITSAARKELTQQPNKELNLKMKIEDAITKPVTFRLNLNKMPTVKLGKPALPGMFQEDNDERSKEMAKLRKPGELFKNIAHIEESELSLYERLSDSTKTNEKVVNISTEALYSPSQCDNEIIQSKMVSDIGTASQVTTENNDAPPKSDIHQEPSHSTETKQSTVSPSKDRRKRLSSSPSKRYRERSRSRSPLRYSYSSKSRRSPQRYKRSRSRSPRRSGGRYRDDRKNSKTWYDRHSHSPSPKRGHHERSRDSGRKRSPSSYFSENKISSSPSSETVPSQRIESITSIGTNIGSFNVNLSEIVLPLHDDSYDANHDYPNHPDGSYFDTLNSPKRPSLNERLRNEHGLYLEDSPSTFDNSTNNAYGSQTTEGHQEYWENMQEQTVSGPSRVIRVGNVLQILPQELPPEEPKKTLIERQKKLVEPDKPKPVKKIEKHSVVPLSPSFSPPPEGRISPLPPPSPIQTVSPNPVTPQVVVPATPIISGPIPGLSSEALISAAAAASAASNVPLAHLISVLQQQNLLPKSVPIPEEKVIPTVPEKQPSPEIQLPETDENKIDLEALKNALRERKLRKKKEKERRRDERKRQREEEMARQIALQQAEEDNDEALIKEAISEVPELEGPVPDIYLMDDDDMNQMTSVHPSISLPPPDKGILVLPTYKDVTSQQPKTVWFADGIVPGEGTSTSEEDETITETVAIANKSVKRKQKKDRPSKKAKSYEIKIFDSTSDGICSPPPPPRDPPPPDAIKLYPGWTHCTYTSPDTLVLYTQQYLKPTLEQIQDSTVMIPPGMLMYSTDLMNTTTS